MEKEIEELKKRIEELEKRPVYIPVYPPIQINPPYQGQQFQQTCRCGNPVPHTYCVWC